MNKDKTEATALQSPVENPTVEELVIEVMTPAPFLGSVPALEELRRRVVASEARITAMLSESTRWQQDAQTDEERAWANVHHAALTRALQAKP